MISTFEIVYNVGVVGSFPCHRVATEFLDIPLLKFGRTTIHLLKDDELTIIFKHIPSMYCCVSCEHIIHMDIAVAIIREGIFYIALTDDSYTFNLIPSPDKIV